MAKQIITQLEAIVEQVDFDICGLTADNVVKRINEAIELIKDLLRSTDDIDTSFWIPSWDYKIKPTLERCCLILNWANINNETIGNQLNEISMTLSVASFENEELRKISEGLYNTNRMPKFAIDLFRLCSYVERRIKKLISRIQDNQIYQEERKAEILNERAERAILNKERKAIDERDDVEIVECCLNCRFATYDIIGTGEIDIQGEIDILCNHPKRSIKRLGFTSVMGSTQKVFVKSGPTMLPDQKCGRYEKMEGENDYEGNQGLNLMNPMVLGGANND